MSVSQWCGRQSTLDLRGTIMKRLCILFLVVPFAGCYEAGTVSQPSSPPDRDSKPPVVSPPPEELDLGKLDRWIAKEPTYTAEQPLYALIVIGPSQQAKVWMVLDKSTVDGEDYDVLYADLNSNGDLTEENERITAKDGKLFELPDFNDPSNGNKHTEFKLTNASRKPVTQMVSMMWRREHKFGGGYPEDPDTGYMSFADSLEEAPIIWINGDGPFRFQRWSRTKPSSIKRSRSCPARKGWFNTRGKKRFSCWDLRLIWTRPVSAKENPGECSSQLNRVRNAASGQCE